MILPFFDVRLIMMFHVEHTTGTKDGGGGGAGRLPRLLKDGPNSRRNGKKKRATDKASHKTQTTKTTKSRNDKAPKRSAGGARANNTRAPRNRNSNHNHEHNHRNKQAHNRPTTRPQNDRGEKTRGRRNGAHEQTTNGENRRAREHQHHHKAGATEKARSPQTKPGQGNTNNPNGAHKAAIADHDEDDKPETLNSKSRAGDGTAGAQTAGAGAGTGEQNASADGTKPNRETTTERAPENSTKNGGTSGPKASISFISLSFLLLPFFSSFDSTIKYHCLYYTRQLLGFC